MLDEDDEGTLATQEPAPFDPSTIRDPLPQPLFSWWRLMVVCVLALAVLCLYIAGRSGGDTNPTASGADSAIESYQPTPGGRVLRQSEVGVVLAAGYDGRITIDGVAIPEEQMVGAIDPESPEYQELSPEQRDLGPRPNNKNVVKYQPGPGKAVTEYATGVVSITIRYWRIIDGPDAATSTSYEVRVF